MIYIRTVSGNNLPSIHNYRRHEKEEVGFYQSDGENVTVKPFFKEFEFVIGNTVSV